MYGPCQNCLEETSLIPENSTLLCDTCFLEYKNPSLNCNNPILKELFQIDIEEKLQLPPQIFTEMVSKELSLASDQKVRPRKLLFLWKKFLYLKDPTCKICHKQIYSWKEAGLDHIYPVSLGGSHQIENLQLTHRKCNRKKGSNVIQ